MSRFVRAGLFWLVCALAPALVLGAGYVGQIVTAGASVDGVAAPMGTTVYPGSVIETAETAAYVHLVGGGILQVAESSSAVVTRESGGIRLAVLSGAAGYLEGAAEAVSLSAGDEAEFGEGETGPGQGMPVAAGDPDEEVAICVLRDPTPSLIQLCNVDEPDNRTDCKWYRKKVERRELAEHFARGCVYADKSLRTEGMNPEVECGRTLIPFILPSTAVGGATVAVLGAGDGNPVPVSPIVP